MHSHVVLVQCWEYAEPHMFFLASHLDGGDHGDDSDDHDNDAGDNMHASNKFDP